MANENKTRVVEAILENPARAFGGDNWRRTRDAWENVRGGFRLLRKRNGDGLTLFFNHGSGRAGDVVDVFDYFREQYGTANFGETLQELAKVYGLNLQFSAEERAKIKRGELARDVAASLVEALRLNPTGTAGRYLSEVRKLTPDGVHFGELTADSLNAAKQSLTNKGKTWNADDLNALGLTDARGRAGYNLVLPYYSNGVVCGFVFRNIRPNHEGPKYLFSDGLEKRPFCDRLERETPAVVVEGQLDALRLMQEGIKNVIALAGATPSEDLGNLLRSYSIGSVVYVPDAETDERGRLKTKITTDAIRKFQALTDANGRPVVRDLQILALPKPEGANGKTDADSYGAANPGTLAGVVEMEPVEAWRWELDRLREQAAEMGATRNAHAVALFVRDGITDIYNRAEPFTRETIRRHVGRCDDLAAFDVTPEALADLDAWNKDREYNKKIKQAAADLNKAVQEHATPEAVGAIVRRLSDAQEQDARATWAVQLNRKFADALGAIAQQPETLRTKWTLRKTTKEGTPINSDLEFYPADISVFCASTSHGKTAVLFAAAFDLLERYANKTVLFVSCEESERQLLERALNVWLPIDTTKEGKDANGRPCFITGTRKRTIKRVIQKKTLPGEYGNENVFKQNDCDALRGRIEGELKRYGAAVFPRLKFVHTEATAESIAGNLLHFVEQYRAAGVEVGAVFVDYMQLLTSEGRNFSRTDELKDVCKVLKEAAAALEIPVIIAAQLNRESLRTAGNTPGIDNITVANIGEGADIERIAHDIFLIWQTDKTPRQWYTTSKAGETFTDGSKVAAGVRSNRIFYKAAAGTDEERTLKEGFLYVEQMKARDGVTGCWGLLRFDGEHGTVGENDFTIMAK